jgi:hypothetical protein
MTYTLIAHTEVGSGGAANITFSSIPATFTDLVILVSARTTGASYAINATINGSTADYTYRALEGDGSGAQSFTQATSGAPPRLIASQSRTGDTANTFGSAQIYIPNYRGSTAKSISIDTIMETNGTTAFQDIVAALWNNTAAINSIALVPALSNFAQYSSATLYGITAGSSGGVVVS